LGRDRGIVHERRVFDVAGLLLQLATDSGATLEAARVYHSTLERARLEQEMKVAAQIQRALLPEASYTCSAAK
jgi:serine phosphatase RsbU (regulator of sigma subunit)